MVTKEGRRQESPSGQCQGCIYLGSFWTRRCMLSEEQTPACKHQMPKGFFREGDSHGH